MYIVYLGNIEIYIETIDLYPTGINKRYISQYSHTYFQSYVAKVWQHVIKIRRKKDGNGINICAAGKSYC